MKYFITVIAFFTYFISKAQQTDVLLDSRYHHLIDRLDIKNPSDFTSSKPYNRSDINKRLADTSLKDLNKEYLQTDNYFFLDSTTVGASKKPVLKHFYTNKPDLYSYISKDFRISFNSLADIKYGGKTDQGERMFLNTRGAEVKGSIDNKIGFYTMVADNQFRYPSYVSDRISSFGAVPNEAFWKSYNKTGYDFFTAKGYINFKLTDHVKVKFGYDKNFIGDGYRSLILSDYAGNYTHLKIETNIWKIKYTNIFADMVSDYSYGAGGTSGAKNFPKKFLTFHHLSINIRKNLNVGLFESIVSGGDSTGATGFDINYMNPIIFYRVIESNIGSGGNALLGGNFKWNFLKHFSLYGQGVLDEFLFAHIKARDGWWANKYAGQLGLKYIDVANIKCLDLQVEANAARPFTYSHTTKSASYSHFNQSLAHPLGSNFEELIGIVRYQPTKKLFIVAKQFLIAQGLDQNGDNYGSNILAPNASRIKHDNTETGHLMLQGNLTKISLTNLQVMYMIKHNIFIEVQVSHRKMSDSKGASSTDNFVNAGLRMNLPSRLYEF